MTEKSFKLPEGRSEGTEIEFIRASALFADETKRGVILEGTLIGTLPNPLNVDRLDYKIELEDGRTVVLNGAGNLKYKMGFVDLGDYIQISYNGKQEITKGAMAGKQAHNFEVLTAE